MRVWMWQRLYKFRGTLDVIDDIAFTEKELDYEPNTTNSWHWLCPKPQLVLVDRKHLGGVE